jgi:CRISPR-associated protein Cas1
MHRLATDGIALVLLDSNGRFQARLEGSVSGNVLLRVAQHNHAQAQSSTLDLAKSFVPVGRSNSPTLGHFKFPHLAERLAA